MKEYNDERNVNKRNVEDAAKKAKGDKDNEQSSKSEKHEKQSGSVLKDINRDAKKEKE